MYRYSFSLLLFLLSSPGPVKGSGMGNTKMSLKNLKGKEEKTEACTFRLPHTLREKMKEYCTLTGATHSGLARVAIEKFLEDQKWKRRKL